MSRLRTVLFLLLLSLIAIPASARASAIYQCTGSRGEVALQDSPCGSARQNERVRELPAPATEPQSAARQHQQAVWIADAVIALLLAYIFLSLPQKQGDGSWQFWSLLSVLLAYPLLWVLNVPEFCALFALICVPVPDSARAVALALLLYVVPAFAVFRVLVGNLDELRDMYWESEWGEETWQRSLVLGLCVGLLHVLFYGALVVILQYGPLVKVLTRWQGV